MTAAARGRTMFAMRDAQQRLCPGPPTLGQGLRAAAHGHAVCHMRVQPPLRPSQPAQGPGQGRTTMARGLTMCEMRFAQPPMCPNQPALGRSSTKKKNEAQHVLAVGG